MNLGPTKTWKVVYYPKILDGGMMGVAFVEADTEHWAMHTFHEQYKGQFAAVKSCTEIG